MDGVVERDAGRQSSRRQYSAPKLYRYGDIREMTLGGSPGRGDSGKTKKVRQPIGPYGLYSGMP